LISFWKAIFSKLLGHFSQAYFPCGLSDFLSVQLPIPMIVVKQLVRNFTFLRHMDWEAFFDSDNSIKVRYASSLLDLMFALDNTGYLQSISVPLTHTKVHVGMTQKFCNIEVPPLQIRRVQLYCCPG
jgi:hypothetical protein